MNMYYVNGQVTYPGRSAVSLQSYVLAKTAEQAITKFRRKMKNGRVEISQVTLFAREGKVII